MTSTMAQICLSLYFMHVMNPRSSFCNEVIKPLNISSIELALHDVARYFRLVDKWVDELQDKQCLS